MANQRLFVGNIPKSKTRDEILDEFEKIASGLIDVIIYASPDDQKKKNRGFAFLEYDTHKSGDGNSWKFSLYHPRPNEANLTYEYLANVWWW